MELTPLTTDVDELAGNIEFTFLKSPAGESIILGLKPYPNFNSNHPVYLSYKNAVDYRTWHWGYPGIPAFTRDVWRRGVHPKGVSQEAAAILQAILEGDNLMPLFLRYWDFRRQHPSGWKGAHRQAKYEARQPAWKGP